jgi:hypothetical protein
MKDPLVTKLWLLGAAVVLTVASGEGYQRIGSEYVRYEGTGPGLDSSRVVVGGWPLPYLLDSPRHSPGNNVSFVMALLGEDHFRADRFAADVLCFWAVLLATRYGLSRVRRAAGRPRQDGVA